jgi:hypothetical protein
MNAGLAKPIHAIWFIQARVVDLHQSLAAALFVVLPSWLRDHPTLPGSGKNCCDAQSKFKRAAPSSISANTTQPALSFNARLRSP